MTCSVWHFIVSHAVVVLCKLLPTFGSGTNLLNHLQDFLAVTSCLACRYVQEADLEFFKDRVERDPPAPGCGKWEHVMAKDFGGVAYTAYKRHLAVSPGQTSARATV